MFNTQSEMRTLRTRGVAIPQFPLHWSYRIRSSQFVSFYRLSLCSTAPKKVFHESIWKFASRNGWFLLLTLVFFEENASEAHNNIEHAHLKFLKISYDFAWASSRNINWNLARKHKQEPMIGCRVSCVCVPICRILILVAVLKSRDVFTMERVDFWYWRVLSQPHVLIDKEWAKIIHPIPHTYYPWNFFAMKNCWTRNDLLCGNEWPSTRAKYFLWIRHCTLLMSWDYFQFHA